MPLQRTLRAGASLNAPVAASRSQCIMVTLSTGGIKTAGETRRREFKALAMAPRAVHLWEEQERQLGCSKSLSLMTPQDGARF